jgi:hypothetical protein
MAIWMKGYGNTLQGIVVIRGTMYDLMLYLEGFGNQKQKED